MKYQFHLWPQYRYQGFDDVISVVRAGEELGYDAVASGEHVLVPRGADADVVGRSYFDPWVLLSALATATSRIELQFCALVVPYRHPAVTARAIASLDHLSNGRLAVVVGAGWARSEFEALGVPFAERGAITDEYVAVMRELWTSDRPSYDGRYVSFPEAEFEPKCRQEPHVRLWVGGRGQAARRRMADYGVGWIPMGASLGQLRETIADLREVVAASGRDPAALDFGYRFTYLDPDPFHVGTGSIAHAGSESRLVATSADHAMEIVAAYAEAGVTRLQVQLHWETPGELVERLQEFSEDVISHTRDT